MKLAVISDVHADVALLARVLEHCTECDRIFNCGDLVGIGDVNRCMDLLESAGALSVAGGHDLEALQPVDDEDGLTLLDAAGEEIPADFGLSQRNRGLLAAWPLFRRHEEAGGVYCFTHGHIRDPRHPEIMEVVDTGNVDAFLRKVVAVLGAPPRVICIGHSHIPRWFHIGPGGAVLEEHSAVRTSLIPLRPTGTCVLDVGSVTLPSWAIIDTEAGTVTLHVA